MTKTKIKKVAERIREVMTGLEDLAVILGYDDANPPIDMDHGHAYLRNGEWRAKSDVCVGCWMDILLGNAEDAHWGKGSVAFANYISENNEAVIDWVFQEIYGGNSWIMPSRSVFMRHSAYRVNRNRPLKLRRVTKVWRKFADNLEEYK